MNIRILLIKLWRWRNLYFSFKILSYSYWIAFHSFFCSKMVMSIKTAIFLYIVVMKKARFFGKTRTNEAKKMTIKYNLWMKQFKLLLKIILWDLSTDKLNFYTLNKSRLNLRSNNNKWSQENHSNTTADLSWPYKRYWYANEIVLRLSRTGKKMLNFSSHRKTF